MAAEKRDYYQVLGLSREAGEKEIKDAFRRLAMKYHPDRNKEAGAEERFKEIAEAYAILGDPQKRQRYDNAGFAGVGDVSQEDLFGGINFDDIFADSGFGGFGLFDHLFHRQRSGPARGRNVSVELVIPLDRVARGGEETLHLRRRTVCSACGGNGAKSGTAHHACPACQGSGRKKTTQNKGGVADVLIQQISVCPACAGRGMVIDQPCPVCDGDGQMLGDETLKVKIPVGIEEGMQLRIRGRGEPCSESGGVSGDLLVAVHSAPDPRFVRKGADLWQSTTIDVVDAALGTELSIPTLDALANVRILPGTQPGAILRLRGKGLPVFGRAECGDLYLSIQVRIPEKLSATQRRLYEDLRAAQRNKN